MDTAQTSALPRHRTDLLKWTSDIVAAYLSRNQTNLKQLPMVMETVYAKLASLGGPDAMIPPGEGAEGSTVAEKSVTPDYIICRKAICGWPAAASTRSPLSKCTKALPKRYTRPAAVPRPGGCFFLRTGQDPSP